jgi:hypothetical protein
VPETIATNDLAANLAKTTPPSQKFRISLG